MWAAIRVIATQGLGAPTATIAKEAGVSTGSLFTYFQDQGPTCLNELYLELKAEMAAAALIDSRKRVIPASRCTICGPTGCVGRRPARRSAGRSRILRYRKKSRWTVVGRQGRRWLPLPRVVERSREGGPMRDAPLGFVVSLMSALADATIDYMIREPANAKKHAKTGSMPYGESSPNFFAHYD